MDSTDSQSQYFYFHSIRVHIKQAANKEHSYRSKRFNPNCGIMALMCQVQYQGREP